MFQNSVFRVSVDTKTWFKAAGVRAIKTFAQAMVAAIGTSAALGEVNWAVAASTAALAAIISVLTSVAGIPEAKGDKEGAK